MRHIIETTTIPATGVAVESVQFSREVRLAVCHTAKALLGELDPNRETKSSQSFGLVYARIKDTFNVFNSETHTPALFIRNAIRVLDMRIQHCNESLKQGDWVDTGMIYGFSVPNITEKTGTTYVKNSDNIISEHYVGTTMELMLATRQILVDSLITVSPDFE
jgi:hypothetical protein